MIRFSLFKVISYNSLMEKYLLNLSNSLLKMLKERQKKIEQEYERLYPYRNVIIHPSHKKGASRKYYYSGDRKYIGAESSEEVIKIKKARYFSQALVTIEKDIKLLEKLLKGYRLSGFAEINAVIPRTYRLQSLDYYEDLPDAGKEWMRKKEAEKAEYGPWHPEGLIHTVSNGIKVRTKSEMAIAEILLRNGIPFVYELPHVLKNGKIVHTDFTILSTIDYKTEFLLEHEGSMADSGYRDKHAWRVENYYLSGYVPNVNIFFTYDGMNGSVDGESIQRIVDGWFRPADNYA